jgi:hypothetical protein
MRDPAPFGEPSPCCHIGFMQWRDRFQQYATCGGYDKEKKQFIGCRRVYWHDGRRWDLVPTEAAERLLKVL